MKEQSNSALRRALKEAKELTDSLRSERTSKDVALQEHLTQIDALKDEKQRLTLCLNQTREELKAERETQSANLTGGSVLNTLFSAADGTLPELNRLKQEKQLFAEELERRNRDLLQERREKISMKEASEDKIQSLQQEMAEVKQEMMSLNELVESREAELSVCVNEKEEVVTQLKVQRKLGEDLASKLKSTVDQTRRETKLMEDKMVKLQDRYETKVPFDDIIDPELRNYRVIPRLIRRKRQWKATSNQLFGELKRLREAVISWRSKTGGEISDVSASAVSKLLLSLNALQVAVQAWLASERTFGPAQLCTPQEAFAKVKSQALKFVEAHEEFAGTMEDAAYFNKLHKRVELAVLGAIGQDNSNGQHIVSLLSEVAEALNDAEGEALQGFNDVGAVVYGMAKICHEHSAGLRDDYYAMSPLQMTTLELARECRKFVDESPYEPISENSSEMRNQLAVAQAELIDTKAKLQRLQQTYEERCEAFTRNEKQLQSIQRENERLVSVASEPLQPNGDAAETRNNESGDTHLPAAPRSVSSSLGHLEDEVAITRLADASQSKHHVDACDEILQDVKLLRSALATTDARALDMEEKHQSMVQLVNKMKQDRKHHNEIISECKAEADRVKATSRNELETTKSSYDIQLKKLTEHIMSLKETLDEKEQYAERLKYQMMSLHSESN